ncbi:MAG: hypothetical protein LBQ33_00985 [Oscillospiraceae bacterium]|nr:hypothetical protein [Oscillospiraceae bacterium]
MSLHAEDTEPEYLEYHEQIDFADLNVAVANVDELVVTVDEGTSLFKRVSARKELDKLTAYMAKYEDVEQELIADVLKDDGDVAALSYTEAPLIEADGHLERISVATKSVLPFTVSVSAATGQSSGSGKYTFTLQTRIQSFGYASGAYVYEARTTGRWSSTSILGGEKHQASGHDFVLQASPELVYSDAFSCKYKQYVLGGTKNGVIREDYWKEGGGDAYVKYAVKDMLPSLIELTDFTLITTHRAQATATSQKPKKINSYYVHTWKKMDLGVSVSGKVSLHPSITLSLTPQFVEKQWQVYDYVVYNF